MATSSISSVLSLGSRSLGGDAEAKKGRRALPEPRLLGARRPPCFSASQREEVAPNPEAERTGSGAGIIKTSPKIGPRLESQSPVSELGRDRRSLSSKIDTHQKRCPDARARKDPAPWFLLAFRTLGLTTTILLPASLWSQDTRVHWSGPITKAVVANSQTRPHRSHPTQSYF